jgi:hypothetical protein
MKKILFCLAMVAAALPVSQVFASNVDFSVGVNIGSRPHLPVVVAPAPVVHAPRVVVHPAPAYRVPCAPRVVTHRHPVERVHYYRPHHRPAHYWGDRHYRHPHQWREADRRGNDYWGRDGRGERHQQVRYEGHRR